MDWKIKSNKKPIAVLGTGQFGTAVAKLIASNASHILLYTHKLERAYELQRTRVSAGQTLPDNIEVTSDLKDLMARCSVIFPIIPAIKFRNLIKEMAPDLTPNHILIHGTKGLDINACKTTITPKDVATMSQVIQQETDVIHVGCLAGPNLASELVMKQPTTTVVASHSNEVLSIGQRLLKHDWFMTYTSHDLLSVEWCSVLKNIFAIGAGLLGGMEYGNNTYGSFMTAVLAEMHYIMEKLGISPHALLSPAGIGDLIATCGSNSSRNYTIGFRLAQGEILNNILTDMQEVTEGVKTVQTVYKLMKAQKHPTPITTIIYQILFNKLTIQKGIAYLMCYPTSSLKQ